MYLQLQLGSIVCYKSNKYKIKSYLNLEKLLLEDDSGKIVIAKIQELTAHTDSAIVANASSRITANAILQLSEHEWLELKNREESLKNLLNNKSNLLAVKETAAKLGISSRQVYNLLNNYKQFGCTMAGLVNKQKTGGKGKSRLQIEVEAIINDAIEELYLNRQRLKPSVVIAEVNKRCNFAGLKPPSQITVRARINKLSPGQIIFAREGAKSARAFKPIIGSTPEEAYPLSRIQIDHTQVDLILVDEIYREPIGRPYLTIAIDVYSRCIMGFYLSLDPPSATSVGLCLLHGVFDKDEWLSNYGIEGEWPIYGKPDVIYVDNASEFHSEALVRGCEYHGIKLEYRPVGSPHYGGIVERVIGTIMQLMHQLPGTTFSNIKEKKDYPSEKKAIFTLKELERLLTIAIVNYYHKKIHSNIQMPPLEKYKSGILGENGKVGRGYPDKIIHRKAFIVDFLPIERRMLRRQGFVLDHIAYYDNALTVLMRGGNLGKKYTLRRDPRDLSRIYGFCQKWAYFL